MVIDSSIEFDLYIRQKLITSREIVHESICYKQNCTQLTQVQLNEKAITIVNSKDMTNIDMEAFKPCQVKSFAFKLSS